MTPKSTIRDDVVAVPDPSALTASQDSRYTTGCTSKPEKARPSQLKAVAATVPVPAAAVKSSERRSVRALLMIALLPLSDAEKANAVQRLMADQTTGPV